MRYAFIPYDAYPFITSGLIVENHPNKPNVYRLEGFGEFWLEPKIVLHGEQGRAAHEELRRWRDEYRKTLSSVTAVFMERLREMTSAHGMTALVVARLTEFERNKALDEVREMYRVNAED